MFRRSIKIRVYKLHPDAKLPKYAHVGSLGDLGADLCTVETIELLPRKTTSIPTGIVLELPDGFGALVEDRSGLATKGLTTLAGVIDPGFRGEIRVVMTNLSTEPLTVSKGERIAQLRLVRLLQAEFEETTQLSATERGDRGFGSTGN